MYTSARLCLLTIPCAFVYVSSLPSSYHWLYSLCHSLSVSPVSVSPLFSLCIYTVFSCVCCKALAQSLLPICLPVCLNIKIKPTDCTCILSAPALHDNTHVELLYSLAYGCIKHLLLQLLSEMLQVEPWEKAGTHNHPKNPFRTPLYTLLNKISSSTFFSLSLRGNSSSLWTTICLLFRNGLQ